jgi:hypothetical protein
LYSEDYVVMDQVRFIVRWRRAGFKLTDDDEQVRLELAEENTFLRLAGKQRIFQA